MVDSKVLKARARRERWRKKNLVKHASYYKKWTRKNPGIRVVYQREYGRKNAALFAARKAKRMAARKGATPSWANEFFIEEIYDLARRRTKSTGFLWSVDHIVPLTSSLVCGLHVEHNLRVIPHLENISKLNRHWPDMP